MVPLSTLLFASCLATSLLFTSCGAEKPSVAVKREQLFSLGYGPAEDQLDLFQLDGSKAPLKTCLVMSEGIFYISNGAGAKVVRYSSFGDPLSMIYNPDKASEPVLLKAVPQKGEAGAPPPGADAEGLGQEGRFLSFQGGRGDSGRPEPDGLRRGPPPAGTPRSG